MSDVFQQYQNPAIQKLYENWGKPVVIPTKQKKYRCKNLVPFIQYLIRKFRNSSRFIPFSCVRISPNQILGSFWKKEDPIVIPLDVQIHVSNKIGEGVYGGIYTVENHPHVVAKIIPFFDIQTKPPQYETKYYIHRFLGEVGISIQAGLCGVGPIVKGFYLCQDKFPSIEQKKYIEQRNNPIIRTMLTRVFSKQKQQKQQPKTGYALDAKTLHGVILMEKYKHDITNMILSPQDIKLIAQKIKKMHQVGILHMDLFPKNVLFRQSENSKHDFAITDFSLSVPWYVEKMGEIPPVLRAVDYITLAQHLAPVPPEIYFDPTEELMTYCIQENGEKATQQALNWLETRYETCAGEYALLDMLPYYLYLWYGPAVSGLLAWSTRCRDEHYQNIRHLLAQYIQQTEEDPKSHSYVDYQEEYGRPQDWAQMDTGLI